MNYFTALKHVTTAILLQSPVLNAKSNLQHDLRLCIYMHSSIACSNTHRVGNIRAVQTLSHVAGGILNRRAY